jgi:hypothetical protein
MLKYQNKMFSAALQLHLVPYAGVKSSGHICRASLACFTSSLITLPTPDLKKARHPLSHLQLSFGSPQTLACLQQTGVQREKATLYTRKAEIVG